MTNDYDAKLTADRIKEIAKSKKITISQLNSICDFSENTIKNAGKSSDGMKAKNLFMIAEVLGCSVDYLLGRTESPDISEKYSNRDGIQAIRNGSVIINTTDNEIMSEFSNMFQALTTENKIRVMHYALELKGD